MGTLSHTLRYDQLIMRTEIQQIGKTQDPLFGDDNLNEAENEEERHDGAKNDNNMDHKPCGDSIVEQKLERTAMIRSLLAKKRLMPTLTI